MNKPIYRHLADKKWREYKRLVEMQRITQMNVAPDLLPEIEISAQTEVYMNGAGKDKEVMPRTSGNRTRDIEVESGKFVASKVSEVPPPYLRVQVFDKGNRFVTLAFIDADIPDIENDSYDVQCQFLAVNIPISPTSPGIRIPQLDEQSQVVHPWRAPYAQKGSNYHRICLLVMQQQQEIDVVEAREKYGLRKGFSMRDFAATWSLHVVGGHLFRVKWDEWTDGIMTSLGDQASEMELQRRPVPKLPYKKRDTSRMRG